LKLGIKQKGKRLFLKFESENELEITGL